MEKEHCPNLQPCPIFHYFKEYAKEVYRAMYCEGDYTTCVRYQLKLRGQPVPENLMPYGGSLWEERGSQTRS